MPTNYPGGLDDASLLPTNRTDSSTSATNHAADHNNANAAIIAMQATAGVGIKPATTLFSTLGSDNTHNSDLFTKGVRVRTLDVGWDVTETSKGSYSFSTPLALRNSWTAAGFQVILEPAVHYPPAWVYSDATTTTGSKFTDQFGNLQTTTSGNGMGPNVIWSQPIRDRITLWLAQLFSAMGTTWYAVRCPGVQFGEFSYPSNTTTTNQFWAYDVIAQGTGGTRATGQIACPVPGWHPGDSSPNGEANLFVQWYLNSLTNYMRWSAAAIGSFYAGPKYLPMPSTGVLDGDIAAAVAVGLNGTSSRASEIRAGVDYTRQLVSLSTQPPVPLSQMYPYSTYGDWDNSAGNGTGPYDRIATMAAQMSFGGTAVENIGANDFNAMKRMFTVIDNYHPHSASWAFDAQLYGGTYATAANYATLIAARS